MSHLPLRVVVQEDGASQSHFPSCGAPLRVLEHPETETINQVQILFHTPSTCGRALQHVVSLLLLHGYVERHLGDRLGGKKGNSPTQSHDLLLHYRPRE